MAPKRQILGSEVHTMSAEGRGTCDGICYVLYFEVTQRQVGGKLLGEREVW
jgi:hypothetical protein